MAIEKFVHLLKREMHGKKISMHFFIDNTKNSLEVNLLEN